MGLSEVMVKSAVEYYSTRTTLVVRHSLQEVPLPVRFHSSRLVEPKTRSMDTSPLRHLLRDIFTCYVKRSSRLKLGLSNQQ